MSFPRHKVDIGTDSSRDAVFELSVKDGQESMDCSDSEMIPSSPKEEAGPDTRRHSRNRNGTGRRRGPRQKAYDDMMAMIDDLSAHNHPLHVFNSQTVEEYNKRRAKAKQPLEPIDNKWRYTPILWL